VAGRRETELLLCDPALRATTASRADLAAVAAGGSAIGVIEAACARFADRPCLGTRARSLTYAEVWRRIRALATGWTRRGLVRPGDHVGILGFASVDWVVADLACLYLGAVSVPLQASLPRADLQHAARAAELRCLVASAEHVGLVPDVPTITMDDLAGTLHEVEDVGSKDPIAPVVPDGDPLVTLLYTSGSTGAPKIVPCRQRRWLEYLRVHPDEAGVPRLTVGYLPLCHGMGRLAVVYFTFVRGGRTVFVSRSDLSTLFDDIRAVRPTFLALIPRVSAMIYQHFQAERVRRGPGAEAAILAEMRNGFLGDRLCRLMTSSAPTPPEIRRFLERCFNVPVMNLYAASELGVITIDDRVRPGVRYRLEDVPELGYSVRDRPYPRGELLVQPTHTPAGDDGNPADGYVRSGDIVEERGPGRIVVIDRRHNVVKLAHGEFVGLARLEETYATGSPFVAQIFVHGDPRRSYLTAVVVPNPDSLRATGDADVKALLRRELERVATAARLPRHELPRDFIVEPAPFTVENGLLTDAGKARRPALRARYGPRLEALADAIDARQLARPAAGADLAARARAVLTATLGVEPDERASFVGLGGDSLAAAQLVARLEDACGAAPPLGAVLDPGTSVAALLRIVGELAAGGAERPTFEAIHGRGAQTVRAADLRLDRFLDLTRIPSALATGRRVLLTGATGWLGRALRAALVARDAEVTSLVRARARAEGPAVEGDLLAPRLGLSAAAFDELADRIDLIVHAGALVNHAVAYPQLFDPNVLGTVEIARLALARRRKPVTFVSSAALGVGLARQAPILERETAAALWPERHVAAGYATSKWAAEVLLAELEVPVAILRCSMVLGHSRHAAVNRDDWVTRMLQGLLDTGIAPRSFYAAAPEHFDGLPVDVVADAVADLALDPTPGHRIYHVSNDRWDDGVSFDRFVDALGDRVVRVGRYDDWYREFAARLERLDEPRRRRSPLAILGWWARPVPPGATPRFDTTELRGKLGRALPGLDDGYIRHMVSALG
jgi:fatty acid CoA ligase FadD9